MLTPPNPFNSLTFCPPFSLRLLFLHLSSPIACLRANCHLRAPAPNGKGGGGRVGCGRGEVAGIMTEAGWRGAENKVALIRICQEQCAHKAAWESNLVLAVSLSDISAISRHRSECETSTLSDFLKSHQWKHKRMSVLEVKKKKKRSDPTNGPLLYTLLLINVSRLSPLLFCSCQLLTLDLNGFSCSISRYKGDFELF